MRRELAARDLRPLARIADRPDLLPRPNLGAYGERALPVQVGVVEEVAGLDGAGLRAGQPRQAPAQGLGGPGILALQ